MNRATARDWIHDGTSPVLITGCSSGIGAKLGGQPDDVAQVIQQAIEVGSPRARYRVTPSATVMIALRDVLPDRAWDAVMRTNFPSPGAV